MVRTSRATSHVENAMAMDTGSPRRNIPTPGSVRSPRRWTSLRIDQGEPEARAGRSRAPRFLAAARESRSPPLTEPAGPSTRSQTLTPRPALARERGFARGSRGPGAAVRSQVERDHRLPDRQFAIKEPRRPKDDRVIPASKGKPAWGRRRRPRDFGCPPRTHGLVQSQVPVSSVSRCASDARSDPRPSALPWTRMWLRPSMPDRPVEAVPGRGDAGSGDPRGARPGGDDRPR
jgi:hypothetical protein